MSDLIDRQALLDECLNHYEVGNIEQNCTMDWICKTVRNFPAASPWHRVEDGLPKEKQNKNYKDFEYVLCATTFGDVRPYKFGTPIGWDEPHFWYGTGGIMDKYVTHWMPLPEPPKEDA